MISQAYALPFTQTQTNKHTHTHTQGKRICVFLVFQFYLTQNFTHPVLTIVSQEDDKLQWQEVGKSNTTSQCKTQYYQVVLILQFHISSNSNNANLAGWTVMSMRTGYTIWKCFRTTVTLTDSVFPEPVWATPTMSRPLMAIGQPWHWIAVGASNPDFLQKCKDMHSHQCGMPEHTWSYEVNRQTIKTQLYEKNDLLSYMFWPHKVIIRLISKTY